MIVNVLENGTTTVEVIQDNLPNTVEVVQSPAPNVVEVITAGPQGPVGPIGPIGPIANTGSFATTSSFNAFTSSYNTGSFTGSFTGSLLGTASYAINATTASYLVGYLPPFPYTGSAVITGSLTVTGSVFLPYGQKLDIGGNLYEYGKITSPGVFDIAAYNFNNVQLSVGNNSRIIGLAVRGTNGNVLIGVPAGSEDGVNKLQVSGSARITNGLTVTGSLQVSGSITGSLFGTASYAQNAATASNILGGKATHIPFFTTDTTLATSSLYQSGSSTVIINQDNATSANPEALYVWQPSTTSFNVISGKGNLNNYLQLNIHNTNQGTAASSDVVATADNGDETVNYIDMGINSENFSGDIGGANDAYLYSTGRHLHIGNVSNYPVQFFAGGLDSDTNRKLELRPDNNHNITGSLEISGSLKVNQGITGSLFGTSSWAVSSSYSISASHAINSQTASYVNPLVQSVTITGSLTITGSNKLIGDSSHTGSVFHSGSKFLNGTLVQTGSLSISGSTTQIGTNNLLGNTTLSGSIIISGSDNPSTPTIKIYGDMETNGVIKFMPVSKNIDTSISASYIFVSGSTNDLYFSQNGSGYNNVTRLRWLEGNMYTGLLNGGLISTASSTTFNISSGSGIVVSLNASLTDNPYPIIKYVNWGNLTNQSLIYRTSDIQTFVGIDSNGAIIQQTTPWYDGQYNESISIGTVIHQNKSTINATITYPNVAYGYKQRTYDFIKAFGPLKISGYTLSTSSSLGLTVGSGNAFADGRNYQVDPNNPSYITDPGTTVSKIFRYYQSGSAFVQDTNAGAGYAGIDTTQYNPNGLGVLTSVSPSKFYIHRIFWYPNSATKGIVDYYGLAQYSTLDEAEANYNNEPFVEVANTQQNAIFLGIAIVKGNSDFTSANDYRVLQGGLFRASGNIGGGSSGATTPGGSTTQIQYNNAGTFGGVPNLTWDGTALRATGSFNGSFSGSFTGSISNAVSASYALTASYALNGGGGAAFPYTGSAQITGSLVVAGPVTITGSFIQGSTGNQATGIGVHAEGYNTIASGESSHAEGYSTQAIGNTSHAEGYSTQAQADYSHAEGSNTIAAGQGSHAEGQNTLSQAQYSHAEGQFATSTGESSHAEGVSTEAIGIGSHAEGYRALATGNFSHAEGGWTDFDTIDTPGGNAIGAGSHAEGMGTTASGEGSHAEGRDTQAIGNYSHAEGFGTVALGSSQHVQGIFNISSSVAGALIHGNGTSDSARSNLIYAHDNVVEITGSLNVTGSINLNGSSITGGGAAFPYTGNAQITGSLLVTSTLQLDGSLTDYASIASTIVGSNNLYTQATGSYTSVFVKYTVSNGANSRAGEFITNWNGTSVTYFDNSTTDIGSTSDIVFSSAIVSSQVQVNATAATSGWKLKTLATFI